MPLRFTLFNCITLLIMALASGVGVSRWKGNMRGTWPLLCYLLIAAFWKFFPGSLNTWLVMTGIVCGLLLRFAPLGGWLLMGVRVAEALVLAYIVVRGVGLLLGWPAWP